MHFIFVACNKNKKLYRNDPSFIYRCENLASGLESLGHTTELMHLSSFSLKSKTDVVLFHRPSYSLKLLAAVLYTKYKSVLAVLDVDDFIFDPKYAKDSPAVRNKILSVKKVEKQFHKNLKALKLFRHFTVSTKPLAVHIKGLIPNSNIVQLSNAVHYSWKNHNKVISDNSIKKLSYFPGTKSHDKDFASIAFALSTFLKNHQDVKLYITGPLNFDLDISSEQIVYNEKVPFDEHWNNYQDIWVNLAPLEKSPFTECKSALKVIEAAYWGIPTLCVLNDDSKRFVDSGAIIVENSEEWIDKLEMLYNSNFYEERTKDLEENILKLANIEEVSKTFIDFIKKQNNRYIHSFFPMITAKNRRKKGLYNYKTLWYYKQAWIKGKSAKLFIDYCMFRRDLGYTLSVCRKNTVVTFLDQLNGKYKKIALSLLAEVDIANKKNILNQYETRDYLRDIHSNQNIWMTQLEAKLVEDKNSICVVGNSANLHNSMLGSKIDNYKLIVRFNKCCNKHGEKDRGSKLNIWVTAPGYRGNTPDNIDFIIVTGPNMIYREAGWKRFKNSRSLDIPVLSVPLEIWKKLVFLLNAPPSAGVLILYWFKEILGGWNNISIVGFDIAISTDAYHYGDTKHKAGSRHNWKREKE
ncbi:MAG: glycosyltransferase family 29 protein, partial [Campylobacterota bacterium]|nr:glycosyltransferase family 29 protein [Campylobacterota bacterium]